MANNEDPVRPLIPASAAPWAEEDVDDWLLARESDEEAASARDLCLLLRWHRATLAERLMVVDTEERRRHYQQYHAALGQAQEALIAYYDLSPTLAEDDVGARGAPPTCMHGPALAGLSVASRLAGAHQGAGSGAQRAGGASAGAD